ncbi:uncharacterized protein LOC118506991 [Anopheles stephensi]|uniref:uncharacterized protein LOC118506991 n=1 Tax=Anopheles stephensi TaxID=30069 RepID=UPI001658C0F6|nr:uncharacterized protein LOC118506991 [Anopheles stephensi]XP_035900760.1 uncharacterized protein LOC118506991 [Anopheles stephensi]XP_035900761.1 uncharacterized protein LOC118506991 [Anopheles stephensi]
MPKQSREATRAKANNRERKRMGKINTTLDSIRKILNLSSTTSKPVTLNKALETLKVLLSSRTAVETGKSDVDEQTVFYEVLTPQTPMDQTNESVTQEESSNILVPNEVDVPSDDSNVFANDNEHDNLLASDEGISKEPAQESGQMLDTENSLAAELQRNLGEESFEWLDWNLPDCDEFFNDDNRLIGLDTEDSLTELEVLYGCTIH